MRTSGVGGSDRISIRCEERCRRESWGSGGLTSHTGICDNEENRAKEVKSSLELDLDWKADSIPKQQGTGVREE